MAKTDAPGVPVLADKIEDATRRFAKSRQKLAERMRALEDDIAALRRRRIAGIKSAVAEAADKQSELADLLAASPGLFAGRRRTLTVDGIKVGWRKKKGKVVVRDEDATIGRIRKHLPDQADLLIQVKESVRKNAVQDLMAGDLKRLGIEITADVDEIVIAPTDSEIDKLVDALLAECIDEEVGA